MPRAMCPSPSDQICESVSTRSDWSVMATYRVFPLDESIGAEGHADCRRVELLHSDCRILALPPFAVNRNSAKSNMVVCDVCQCCRSRFWRDMPWAPFERETTAIWYEIRILWVHRLHETSVLATNQGS